MLLVSLPPDTSVRHEFTWSVILYSAFIAFSRILSPTYDGVCVAAFAMECEDECSNFFSFWYQLSVFFTFVALGCRGPLYPGVSVATALELTEGRNTYRHDVDGLLRKQCSRPAVYNAAKSGEVPRVIPTLL